ncbi:DUF3140 domain-containing protein [Streptomyces sp. NPDC059785]|uniref:DUF3140 domain-containing protein n=1 Tax=unclassified Streptomyces TaxID=2593676 RepID=UPI003664B3E6
MTDALELDALWDEFHRVVNMTSQELAAWLQLREADEDAAPPPEHAGAPTGEHVLGILQKRRTDLTDEDVEVMWEVVDTVAEQGDAARGSGDDEHRRHQLMTLGHDPLKPAQWSAL